MNHLKHILLPALLMLLLTVAISQAADVERITITEVKSRLDAGEKLVFLDTRNDYAWQTSEQMIPDARRVHDNQSFGRILAELPKGAPIVTYCT